MRRCKALSLVALFSLVLFSVASLRANGLNLNGQGSKAIAMGGAFIGQADDYSAVFWNPAGLTQMTEMNFAIFGTDLIPSATYQYSAAGVDAQTVSKMYPSGAVGFFKPINKKLVVGILGYVPAGSGATWDAEQLKALTYNLYQNAAGTKLEWESMIGVISVSPAIAYKATDWLSLGATFNANYAFMKLKKPAPLHVVSPFPPHPTFNFAEQYEESTKAWAFGATFGVMVKPMDKLSIGLTVRTPVKINFKGDASNGIASNIWLQMSAPGTPNESSIEREATWPLWAGLGLSFKPIAKLTLNFDLQYTQWSKIDKIEATYDATNWQALFGAGGAVDLRWEDTIQYRFGAEYKFCSCWALRVGYYYDPCVGPDETLTILLPQFTYNVVTLGVGYNTGKISLDFCVEYLMGKERTIDKSTFTNPLTDPGMPGVHGMSILVPNLAFSYRF